METLTLKIRYKQPEGGDSRLLEFPIGDDGAAFYEASDDFRFAAAVAAFGMSLRGSEHCGAWTLDEALMSADTARGADFAEYRAEFVGLIQKAMQARTVEKR
ncbi:hypothetical protein RAS1_35920 [Phycisphaerae bacterium RAS1]|nr:hypothetical protein RAS1_35920 [Phycisphaerae bacterium RAS1]